MNKRLEKLAKEAAEYAIEFATQDQELYIPKLMEKFAALIVQECVGVAVAQMDWVENMVVFSERDEFWNKARIVQSQRIVDKIKQHFGVK